MTAFVLAPERVVYDLTDNERALLCRINDIPNFRVSREEVFTLIRDGLVVAYGKNDYRLTNYGKTVLSLLRSQ